MHITLITFGWRLMDTGAEGWLAICHLTHSELDYYMYYVSALNTPPSV